MKRWRMRMAIALIAGIMALGLLQRSNRPSEFLD
jgi:hypothetical protein